jgi:hypothetical protein
LESLREVAELTGLTHSWGRKIRGALLLIIMP